MTARDLPSRYEIRTLGPEHLDWVRAIYCFACTFESPFWVTVFPDDKTHRYYRSYKAMKPLALHALESGCTLGVFDKEYQFRNPESAATNGKLYIDLDDESLEIDQLREQLDFPLVSIALAFDSFNHPAPEGLAELASFLPMAALQKTGKALDRRQPGTWEPTAPGQVLARCGSATRGDYEGRGLMKNLAHYMMRRSAEQGFRAIEIQSTSDAIRRVWSDAPAPFRSEMICEYDSWDVEEERDGEVRYPLRPGRQTISKWFVLLK